MREYRMQMWSVNENWPVVVVSVVAVILIEVETTIVETNGKVNYIINFFVLVYIFLVLRKTRWRLLGIV